MGIGRATIPIFNNTLYRWEVYESKYTGWNKIFLN